ncbi:MAG: aminodeoxychorismate/anthranilate synthase component II [Planctomycetales bacterium]|nr:aminodeoxychorismate/anthranilate synthase component II [Planctomycetales bacterium]
MLVVIDNYDSFVHNLARYLRQLGQETYVVRNDQVTPHTIRELNARALVISPGPGTPTQAGNCLQVVRELQHELPMLGVCLGHQVIAEAAGGTIVRAPEPIHGRASYIQHAGVGLFAELPNPLRVGRYHSLVVQRDTLPDTYQVTAWTDDGTLMAYQHRELPMFGLQFHPESVLTQFGYHMLAAFLQRADLPVPSELPQQPAPEEPDPDWFTTDVSNSHVNW